MEKLVEKIMQNVPGDIFTDDMVLNMLPGTADSRHGIVKRAIAKGEIIHIKRGLYALAKRYQRQGIDLFALSQLIHGPSYVSFESALNYHGWIPEAVYAVTCASARYAKQLSTPLGVFIFKRIPIPMLLLGVERIASHQGSFLMARPCKALVDYVYVHKKDWCGIEPVMKSLRIEKESLENIDRDLLDQLQEIYKNLRVQNFIKGIKKDLS